MARRKTAIRSIRKEKKERAFNKSHRTFLKTAIKRYKKIVSLNDPAEAKKSFAFAISSLDKAACKRLIPKNRVARKKSQLAKLLNKVSATS
ncbi:MAG: 30S ribosomal protein S20 [bacterium (Candidatus Ratteibacteria) CG_4_10_14_3_um_filter_41_18]|uniref:Small ribosomal subunit protein bS20 n=4 Tax=Candidatus Ratteibacteria TaxID=2979319 RepID=A0A2M7YDY2_9BACT|nr:MAG: 30S ribosomal protein S20 [bacterium (Candidatus Ratteibacteria) CG01_land_8_20_14_3_00_40_19]PIW33146.1 MAG: 30S ribosomal protein S20 [bacterium (Candidatus Ratteibacteria) CG15_BIG_FIL_POST_REV_8_21_14_020_41_12]PIX77104.1 MAG: 30S ribosomal protein S20 [bacterium (Candidatus Ratteibacteria) CG_4_10_14_3_um_filter_41_18]PJA61177.1 MAG: 30S ribosomal protein S20 [bacterium (Candidatus Ratteibacteria) CG_4_9_14_3_um_filter_41_21]HCG76991.1 30S ribosomal protein S20 [bacterium]